MAAARIIRNKDGTITVRVKEQIEYRLPDDDEDTIRLRTKTHVEHVDTIGKSKVEVFDAVKYALISKGATLTDIAITELLQQLSE